MAAPAPGARHSVVVRRRQRVEIAAIYRARKEAGSPTRSSHSPDAPQEDQAAERVDGMVKEESDIEVIDDGGEEAEEDYCEEEEDLQEWGEEEAFYDDELEEREEEYLEEEEEEEYMEEEDKEEVQEEEERSHGRGTAIPPPLHLNSGYLTGSSSNRQDIPQAIGPEMLLGTWGGEKGEHYDVFCRQRRWMCHRSGGNKPDQTFNLFWRPECNRMQWSQKYFWDATEGNDVIRWYLNGDILKRKASFVWHRL